MFGFETDKYSVSIARPDELGEIFSLRKKVFDKQFPGLSLSLSGDYLDGHAFYIACREKASGRLLASCRLIEWAPYYSDYEFEMSHFYDKTTRRLEVSRFCVDETARQGRVVMIMMRALAAAALYTKAEYLFGLTSAGVNLNQDNIRHWIRENGHEATDFKIQKLVPAVKNQGIERKIPPLMKAYISFGGKIFLEPAYDSVFECFDYMTLMRTKDIDRRIISRLGRTHEAAP